MPGLSSATQPARGRGRRKERPTPPSPLQKQLKMKHTRLHNSARIRSRHAKERHPRPPLPALEMPPGLPSIRTPPTPTLQAVSPQKLIGKLGSRKRLHPLPYLPVERCSRKGNSERNRQLPGESRSGCFPLRLDRSRIQWPWYGRADSGLALGGSDLIVFAKTLTKDTDWEQTKHSRGRNLGKCRDRLGPNTRHQALGRETSLAKQALSLELLQSRVGAEQHCRQAG